MKRLVLVVVVIAILACSGCAQRQAGPPPPPMPPAGPGAPDPPVGPGMMLGPAGPPAPPMPPIGGLFGLSTLDAVSAPNSLFLVHARNSGLSEAKLGELKKLLDKDTQANQQLVERASKANQALRTALFAKSFDQKRIEALAAESSKHEAALVKSAIGTWKGIRGILTAEQTSALFEKMRPPFGLPGPMGPGGRGPGGMHGPGMPPPPGGPMGPGGPGMPPPPPGGPMGPPPGGPPPGPGGHR